MLPVDQRPRHYRHKAKEYLKALVCSWLLCSFASAQETEPATEVLSWLGVSAAINQVDRTIDNVLVALSLQGTLNAEQLTALRKQLLAASGSEIILAGATAYVAQQLPADVTEAEKIFKSDLVQRVRNFDVAMEVPGAYEKFKTFQQEPLARQDQQRIALAVRLDELLRTSAIASVIQTEIETTALLLAEKLLADTASMQLKSAADLITVSARQQDRKAYLAEVVTALHLYSYLYMKTDELEQYVALMENAVVQELMDISEKAIAQAIRTGRAVALQ